MQVLAARSGIKGECTLLVTGWDQNRTVQWETVANEIRDQLSSTKEPVSKLAKKISQQYGLSKNKVYREALKIIDQMTDDGGQKTDDPTSSG